MLLAEEAKRRGLSLESLVPTTNVMTIWTAEVYAHGLSSSSVVHFLLESFTSLLMN